MEKKKRNNWDELKNLKTEKEKAEWVKKFCDKHGITSPTQLAKEYPRLKKYYLDLSKEYRKEIFIPKKRDWSEIKNFKNDEERTRWIKNFCDEHKIISPGQLSKEFYQVFKCYSGLSEKYKREIFPFKRIDWSEIRDLKTEKEKAEWIKKFCDKHGITSYKQLRKKYPTLVDKYYTELSQESKNEIFSYTKISWVEKLKDLSNEEELVTWIIKFCDEHEITSPSQLLWEYPGLNKRYQSLSRENRRKVFPPSPTKIYWEEEIGELSEDEQVAWTIDFCNEHGITSAFELQKDYKGLYLYYLKFSQENKQKVFPVRTSESYGEKTTGKFLTEAGFIFTTQKTFPDLKGKSGKPLYYDIFIPGKNCLIEFHGEQHFNPRCLYYSEEGIERDKIKYQYAIDHKINIFYIAICGKVLKEHKYFTEVLTDWDKLIENINSLPDVIVDAEDTAQN